MKAKEKFKNIVSKLKDDKRLVIIVVLGLTGILLLTFSEIVPDKENKKESSEKKETVSYEEKMEKRLTEIVSSINGAGKTKVMITLESGDENVYAVENKSSEKQSESKFVVVDNNGEDSGLLLKVVEPEIKGVAVVCEGGDSPQVRQEIIATVTAVLRISTNRVNIAKISNGG